MRRTEAARIPSIWTGKIAHAAGKLDGVSGFFFHSVLMVRGLSEKTK